MSDPVNVNNSQQQWAKSPHWPIGPWYIRPNGHGDYVAYQSSRHDNPLWWALNEAVFFHRNGRAFDLPPGLSIGSVKTYVDAVKGIVGQEVVISRRQAEEFTQILRTMSELPKDPERPTTALATWAIEASLKVLLG
jgi:hypothetical protein